MANEIITEIILDLDSMKKKLKEAEGLGAATGKKAGDDIGGGLESSLLASFGPIKAAVLGIGALIAGAFSMKAAIDEAMQSEDAVNRFNSALRASGDLTPQVTAKFQEYASSLQKISGVSDEVILNNAAILVSLGNLKGQGLEQATKAALDLAAGMNIDVDTAFRKVALAANGNTEALKKYGITVTDTGDKTLNFANALDQLGVRFGGMAEDKANTFSGSLKKLSNSFNDVLEEIGKIITQSPFAVAVIKKLSDMFMSAAESVKRFAQENGDIIGKVAAQFLKISKVIIENVGPPVELLFNLIRTGALTVVTAISMMVEGWALLGRSIIEFVREPILGVIGAVAKLVGIFDKDMAASLNSFAATAVNTTSETLGELANLSRGAKEALAAQTVDSANSIFTFNGTQALVDYNDQMIIFTEGVIPINQNAVMQMNAPAQQIPSVWEQVLTEVKRKLIDFANFVKQVSNAMVQAIQTFSAGLGRGFAQVGANLVNGASAFKDFGKIMLSVLGDIAIQFGTTFILMGIAKSLLFDPTGPALIAAGAALAVVGGALKAMGGGGGAGGSANIGAGLNPGAEGGQGGGVATGGGFTQENQLREDKQQASVNVVIQGNVLDRRQTGLEIAEVINETFGSNGVQFNAGANA